MDFMRDKLGWAASNPGLVAAQARLSGDKDVQSMVELLSRAHLIGEEADQAHGLGLHAPVTGPPDISGNVFDQSFGIPRSTSPPTMDEPASPKTPPQDPDQVLDSLAGLTDRSTKIKGDSSLHSLSKAVSDDSSAEDVATNQPRMQLKRTFTSTDELSLQNKLTDTLAKPYTVNDDAHEESAASTKKYPSLPPLKIAQPVAGSHAHLGPHSAAPHGHGSRWTPAAQAIFTTEATAPWTITAANDLACLVFGVTKAEVRKLGILEVVKEERRKWLEEKLRDPDAGSYRGKGGFSHSQRNSPSHTTALNVGSGLTAKLLSKPSSRAVKPSRRSQTDDGAGSSYAARSKTKGGLKHAQHKSRGVLLCGDVVPILKRNGTLGSASLWVKEKKGGLIWVLEEIAEDVAIVGLDEVGCVTSATGSLNEIWSMERIRRGMDIKRLIPAIPRKAGTNTGALDFKSISDVQTYTARTANDVSIPVTVEQLLGEPSFRVSSFPHIAGIMVLNSKTLQISSSNTVFSSALFGQAAPEGLHITDIIPSFDKILHLMTDEDKIRLVDGIVIPEHNFRRARALLAMREGKADAASVFLRPSGVPARHRDGSDILVDVQMRVVKSERSHIEENVIDEVEEQPTQYHSELPSTEVVYALWITYSRQLHAGNEIPGASAPPASQAPSPCQQPIPGISSDVVPLELDHDRDSSGSQPVSLLSLQLRGEVKSPTIGINTSSIASATTPHGGPLVRQGSNRTKKITDFVVLEDMGQGAYGQVKLCRYKSNSSKKMVIKYVTKKRILVDTWTRDRRLGTVPLEIHVLDYLRRDDLKHGNIVEMADFFEDDINYYIEMVPHGLPGMDLFDYIELRANMEEWEARKIFVQVAEALLHLHINAKVVHRDIKDENVI